MRSITKKDIFLFFAITLSAFLLRYWHITIFSLETKVYSPFWLVDSSPYLFYASKILAGEPFFPWQSPLTGYLVALVFKLIKHDYFTVKIVLAFLGSISCGMIYLIGVKTFNRFTGFLASILSASYFGLIITSGSFNSEVLYTALLSLIILLICTTNTQNCVFLAKFSLLTGAIAPFGCGHRPLCADKEKMSIWGGIFVGILGGLASLTRGEFILLLPFIIFWHWQKSPLIHWKKALVISMSCIAMFLTILPWSIKNYYYFKNLNAQLKKPVYKEFALLSPFSQFIFAQSNSPLSQGGSDRRLWGSNQGPFEWKTDVLNNPLHRKFFLNGYEEGFKFIRENPAQFIKIVFIRMDYLTDSLGFGFMEKNFPGGLKGDSRTHDSFIPDNRTLKWLHLFLFVTGVFFVARFCDRNKIIFLLIAIPVVATNIFYFGLARYGLTIVPFIFLIEAAGIYFLFSKGINNFFDPHYEKIGLVILTTIIFIGFIEARTKLKVPFSHALFSEAQYNEEKGNNDLAINNYETSFALLEKKERVIKQPLALAMFHFRLAKLYYINKDFSNVEKNLLEALRLDPIHQNAILNLGLLYLDHLNAADKTIDLFRLLLKYYPNDPQAHSVSLWINEAALNASQKQDIPSKVKMDWRSEF